MDFLTRFSAWVIKEKTQVVNKLNKRLVVIFYLNHYLVDSSLSGDRNSAGSINV